MTILVMLLMLKWHTRMFLELLLLSSRKHCPEPTPSFPAIICCCNASSSSLATSNVPLGFINSGGSPTGLFNNININHGGTSFYLQLVSCLLMMLVVPTWVTVDLGVDYGIEKNFTITFVVFLVFSLGCICVCFNNLMVCVLVRHLYFLFSLF